MLVSLDSQEELEKRLANEIFMFGACLRKLVCSLAAYNPKHGAARVSEHIRPEDLMFS